MEAYRGLAESKNDFTNFPDRDPETPSFVGLAQDSRDWVTPALSPEESSALRTRFEGGLTQLLGAERTAFLLRNASDDDSLSRCFQQFGAEDLVIALTRGPEGGCSRAEILRAKAEDFFREHLDDLGTAPREFLRDDSKFNLWVRYTEPWGQHLGATTFNLEWNRSANRQDWQYGHLFGQGAPGELKVF